MTLQFYLQSIAKRAEGLALIDSGATENFMNLDYARWLKLPIRELKQHHPLFNVDGMENKSGALHYYTDLQFRTGTQTTNQRFYLLDLGDHKAIFGYPWFAAFQPRVDWKRGWIDIECINTPLGESKMPHLLQSSLLCLNTLFSCNFINKTISTSASQTKPQTKPLPTMPPQSP